MEKHKISVCVGNYGYYNEGELRDRWITLPRTDEEIRQFLQTNGLQDPLHEEIYISDYDGYPFGLSCGDVFNQYTSLDGLNLLAKQLELHPHAAEQVQAALDSGADAPGSLLGLMNWIEQADAIPYHKYDFKGIEYCKDRSPEEKFGRSMAESEGLRQYLESGNLDSYFDFEAYGRDVGSNFSLGPDGYMDGWESMPDEGRYDWEELRGKINAAWAERHEEPSAPEPSLADECRDARDASAQLSGPDAPPASCPER